MEYRLSTSKWTILAHFKARKNNLIYLDTTVWPIFGIFHFCHIWEVPWNGIFSFPWNAPKFEKFRYRFLFCLKSAFFLDMPNFQNALFLCNVPLFPFLKSGIQVISRKNTYWKPDIWRESTWQNWNCNVSISGQFKGKSKCNEWINFPSHAFWGFQATPRFSSLGRMFFLYCTKTVFFQKSKLHDLWPFILPKK